MRLISNVGNESIQRHTILFENNEIILRLRFFAVTEIWTMDVTYNGESIRGTKLSTGIVHMIGQNWPFDFIVTDESGNGIDPFQKSDFTNGRCHLYLLEPSEIEQIRGVPVEIP